MGGFVIAVVIALIVAGAGWVMKRFVLPRVLPALQSYWSMRQFRKNAPTFAIQLASYMTHLRDGAVGTFWRAHGTAPEAVRETIRRQILEPIRGYVATLPGEEIKVVWFRPDVAAQFLQMYEQVGHTPEGQSAMRLRIGVGLAGRAYAEATTYYSANVQADERFQPVEKGKATGSLACVPIMRGQEVTGVLSVLSTWEDAFRFAEILYFEALAAAIGATEVLEERN